MVRRKTVARFMIASILIPTRKRVERLRKCLRSLQQTSSPGSHEVWLAVDDDDAETLSAIPGLQSDFPVNCIIGKRIGWQRLSEHFDQLSDLSTGVWSWIMNDDATIEGSHWDTQLSSIPTSGFIVQSETMRLGGSRYHRPDWTAFPLVPRLCWKKYATSCPTPADLCLWELLVKENGWKTVYLTGVTANHQRDADAEIERHRQ